MPVVELVVGERFIEVVGLLAAVDVVILAVETKESWWSFIRWSEPLAGVSATLLE